MKNRNFKNVNGEKYYFFTRNEKYILKSVDKSTVIQKKRPSRSKVFNAWKCWNKIGVHRVSTFPSYTTLIVSHRIQYIKYFVDI